MCRIAKSTFRIIALIGGKVSTLDRIIQHYEVTKSLDLCFDV